MKNAVFSAVFGAKALGQRPTTLTIITRTYSGPNRGSQVPFVDSTLVLPQYTKIRHVSQREIAGSGGAYEEGDVICTEIMPIFTDPVTSLPGGFTESQLHPLGAQGNSQSLQSVEIIYRLSQVTGSRPGIAGDYSIVELKRAKSWGYILVIGRRRTTP